jgi:hypothetical protein
MRLTVLDQRTLIHDNDLVEVKDCVEFMRDSDNSVRRKLLTQEALDNGIGGRIKASI